MLAANSNSRVVSSIGFLLEYGVLGATGYGGASRADGARPV